MTFHEFKYYLGETIMFCQIIESDIKIIYVNLLGQDKEITWKLNEKETLGSMIKKLQALDKDNKLLSNDDYYYLHQVAGKRNHWCHQTYINFLYTGEGFRQSTQYQTECQRLLADHAQLEKIYRVLEEMRINLVRNNRK
ncbi:MAG: hypothetical protein KBS35_01050 [Mycoplasma sp.]|nr:hypothetical protein [Candidatus Hennigella equi]